MGPPCRSSVTNLACASITFSNGIFSLVAPLISHAPSGEGKEGLQTKDLSSITLQRSRRLNVRRCFMQSTLGFFLAAMPCEGRVVASGRFVIQSRTRRQANHRRHNQQSECCLGRRPSNRPPQKRLLFLRLLSVNEGGWGQPFWGRPFSQLLAPRGGGGGKTKIG